MPDNVRSNILLSESLALVSEDLSGRLALVSEDLGSQ